METRKYEIIDAKHLPDFMFLLKKFRNKLGSQVDSLPETVKLIIEGKESIYIGWKIEMKEPLKTDNICHEGFILF